MLAVLGVAVAVVAVIAITQPTEHTRQDVAASPSPTSSSAAPTTKAPSSSASSSSRPRSSGPSLSLGPSSTSTASKLPLVVLNNSQVSGLAAQAADQFRNGGWTVTDTGNLVNDIISTCAYYDPSVDGAQQAAEQLQRQFPGIQRVEQKFAELPAGPIVVVLTGDYQVG